MLLPADLTNDHAFDALLRCVLSQSSKQEKAAPGWRMLEPRLRLLKTLGFLSQSRANVLLYDRPGRHRFSPFTGTY